MKPRNKIQPLPFVLPALFVYILTVIIPILWSMGYSLFSWNGIGDMKFIGLENYVRMFQDETFREAVVNNLKFVVLGSLFQLCAGLILAICLHIFPKVEIFCGYLFYSMYHFIYGDLPDFFQNAFCPAPGPGLLCDGKTGEWNLSLCWQIPHTALITITLIDGYKYMWSVHDHFYSAFVSISKDVIEASTMDGCNVFQQYRYIKLPLVKNIFSIVIVMLVNGCLKTFDVFYILDNKSRSTEMVATYMYKTAFNSADFGYGSTLSVFLVIECLVAVGIIQKCLGSAKGDGSE